MLLVTHSRRDKNGVLKKRYMVMSYKQYFSLPQEGISEGSSWHIEPIPTPTVRDLTKVKPK